jgi:hypothetical protein
MTFLSVLDLSMGTNLDESFDQRGASIMFSIHTHSMINHPSDEVVSVRKNWAQELGSLT